MSEKNYFGEMKLLLKEEKKLVIGGLTAILILLVMISVWFIQKGRDERQDSMPDVMTEYLEKAGFSYLPEENIEELSEKVTKVLNEMVATETDKGKMIQSVKEAILGMDLSISDSEADELAAWLVELYLDNYDAVYGESGKMNHSLQAGHNLLKQMELDLLSMQEYLNNLEQSVQKNQQELSNLSDGQNNNYTAANEYLDRMETLVTELQNEFNSYENKYANGQNSMTSEFSVIKTELAGLLTQISDSKNAMEEYIGNIDTNNSVRYDAVQNKVDSLQNNLTKSLSEIKDSLNSKINELQKESSENNTELAEDLKTVEEKLAKDLQTSRELLLSALTDLEKYEAERMLQLTDTFDGRVTELSTFLNEIHLDISQSQSDIQEMLTEMKTQDTAQMNDIMEQFEQINSDMADINDDMNSAHAELKTLIVTLQKSEDENHTELLSRLSEMDDSFGQQNEENYQALISSMQTQSADFRTAFDSLNSALEANVTSIHQGMEDSKTEMLQQLSVVENHLDTSVMNLTSSMSGNQEEVLNRIADVETSMSNSLAGVQNDLKSVFQSVSNGKALLASALLTKNVKIGEDATFRSIYDAILAVPQEIVLGETKIPGEIVYEYHYHTGTSVNGGGCYTIEDVHQHVGSCYVTCNYTNGGCVAEGNYLIDGYIHCPYEYKHSYCTGGKWEKGEYVHVNDGKSHRGESSGTHLVVVCGKTEGTHYGWKTGCGLNDGQIIGAKITYDAAAVSSVSAVE